MSRLGALPLACQPGERWLYHMSAEILGVLIARVTGTSLGAFLQERIFEPLGMKDTGFHVPESKLERLAACWGRDPVSGELVILDEVRGGYAARPGVFESGAGGLVSTADDLLAFGRMMLGYATGGGEHILSRPTIELMTADHITPAQKALSPFFEHYWDRRSWGLGMSIITARTDLADAPGRFGWDGAFGTSLYVDPREDLVGVLMTQRRPDQLGFPPVTVDFWNSVYQLIEA
jgi:CubicO group peptidase (beta-lactamase class C family)